jgi:hypothetical protein
MELASIKISDFEWKISVSIFSNRTILSQLAIGIGIPFGILILVLIFLIDPENISYTFYALGLIAALFFFTYLLILVVYRGKYEVCYQINEKGISCYSPPNQAKKNRTINGLTFVLGVLTRKPAVLGAGIIAETKQSVFIPWSDIQKVTYTPNQNTIFVKGHPTQTIAIFCSFENYKSIENVIKQSLT